MLKYELKKIFSRNSSRLAVLLLLLTLLLVCFFAIWNVSYVNEDGETETGIRAVQQLKQAKQQWSGLLTEEKLAAVIAENAAILETQEYQSENLKEKDIAYSWGQGISDIREIINRAFCGFREYDYYRINSLTEADAADFYPNRIIHLKEWLDTEAKDRYSQAEKDYIINSYETLKTPFEYGYADGWKELFEFSPTIIMITMLILGFLVAGIFSSECSLKADAIFFSSRHGRGKAVRAKAAAGVVLVTGIYWTMMLLYSLVVLGILGTDGAGLTIQSSFDGTKSLYHLTNDQEYLLVLTGGYLGCLFIALLTMLVSAGTKSAVLAVMVPFIVIFLPSFLGMSQSAWVAEVAGLLPDQLLQMNMVVKLFNIYEICGRVFLSAGILFVLYSLLTVVLCLVVYIVYKRTEVK